MNTEKTTLVKCRACAKEISVNAKACPNCGEPTTEPADRTFWIFLALFFASFPVFAFGNFHVVTGTPDGWTLKARESFGYSEIFVNMEEITGMPWIAAKSRYPIGCRVLQKMHLIETDEEMTERINRKSKEDMDEALSRLRRQY